MNSKKNYYQLYLKYKGRYLAEQKRQEGGVVIGIFIIISKLLLLIKTKYQLDGI